MYYIYHIPNIKIGCSTVPSIRVNEQGYTEFEILEEHADIYEVSKREKELQKEYGLPIDNIPYYQSVLNRKKGTTKESLSKGGSAPRKHHGQKTIRVQATDINGKFIGIYESITAAGKALNLHKGNIHNVVIGRDGVKQHKGYCFKKI
jgi:hypothetical protein